MELAPDNLIFVPEQLRALEENMAVLRRYNAVINRVMSARGQFETDLSKHLGLASTPTQIADELRPLDDRERYERFLAISEPAVPHTRDIFFILGDHGHDISLNFWSGQAYYEVNINTNSSTAIRQTQPDPVNKPDEYASTKLKIRPNFGLTFTGSPVSFAEAEESGGNLRYELVSPVFASNLVTTEEGKKIVHSVENVIPLVVRVGHIALHYQFADPESMDDGQVVLSKIRWGKNYWDPSELPQEKIPNVKIQDGSVVVTAHNDEQHMIPLNMGLLDKFDFNREVFDAILAEAGQS